MIKAINHKSGLVTEFSDIVWNLLPPNKNGFVEISENANPSISIPKEIQEFKLKREESKKEPVEEDAKEKIVNRAFDNFLSDKPIVDFVKKESDMKEEMAMMREYLKSKGIKTSHLLGYDKLKATYDENREQEE